MIKIFFLNFHPILTLKTKLGRTRSLYLIKSYSVR
jgi:hypothetical protein